MLYNQITSILPHRYPLLLIDKVLECMPGERITCLKNVTANEEFFQGHFPGKPVMPGIFIVEAAAQAGIILFEKTLSGEQSSSNKDYLLSSVKVNFLKPVIPGDQLIICVEPVRLVMGAGILSFNCAVEDEIVAKGEFVFAAKEKNDSME